MPTVASVLVLAGCAAEPDPEIVDRVVEALRKTSMESSAEVTIGIRLDSPVGSVRSDLSGVIDLQSGEAILTMAASVGGGRRIGNMRVILTGSSMFVKRRNSGPADDWIKIDLVAARRLTGPAPGAMFDFAGRDAVVGTEDLGEEPLGATPARHFRLELDTSKLPSLSDSGFREAASTIGVDVLGLDVWVGDGLARTISFSAEADQASFEMTFAFSDFGVPVEAMPPPGRVRHGSLEDLFLEAT